MIPATQWRGKLRAFRADGVVTDEGGLMGVGADSCPRILIVDDDPDIRDGLSRGLMTQGRFEVACAEDGFDAGYKFARSRPHVVILDVIMKGMGGLDICGRIRRLSRADDVKIIVLTGFASDRTSESSLFYGADLMLRKPQDVQTLLLHIEDLLTD